MDEQRGTEGRLLRGRKASPGLADQISQALLDVEVDVLELGLEDEAAGRDLGLDLHQATQDRIPLGFGEHADRAAPRVGNAPAEEICLRHGGERPVELRPPHPDRGARDGGQRSVRLPAGLDEQDLRVRVFAQAGSEDAPCGSGADDDVAEVGVDGPVQAGDDGR